MKLNEHQEAVMHSLACAMRAHAVGHGRQIVAMALIGQLVECVTLDKDKQKWLPNVEIVTDKLRETVINLLVEDADDAACEWLKRHPEVLAALERRRAQED